MLFAAWHVYGARVCGTAITGTRVRIVSCRRTDGRATRERVQPARRQVSAETLMDDGDARASLIIRTEDAAFSKYSIK